jgi:hypothetical protein
MDTKLVPRESFMNSDRKEAASKKHAQSGKAARDGNQSEFHELVSVDETIDAIAREALEEARRVEEAERYRNIPGPVVPPHTPKVAP